MFLRAVIRERLGADPFEPFRIRFLPDQMIDISEPGSLAALEGSVYFVPRSDDWIYIPYAAITAVENLMQDFQGGSPEIPSDPPSDSPGGPTRV